MNAQERFLKIMHFEKPDRVPLWDLEGITEQAVRRWCGEGMPIGMNIRDYIGFDRDERIPLDTGPIPSFVPRIVEEDEKWRTEIDIYGFKVRISKEQSMTPRIYYYLEGSVKGSLLTVMGCASRSTLAVLRRGVSLFVMRNESSTRIVELSAQEGA